MPTMVDSQSQGITGRTLERYASMWASEHMSITKRQFGWLVSRMRKIAYESSIKHYGVKTCVCNFFSKTKVIEPVAVLSCHERYCLYLFRYHGEPMYIELEDRGTFLAWEIAHVSKWGVPSEREEMMKYFYDKQEEFKF